MNVCDIRKLVLAACSLPLPLIAVAGAFNSEVAGLVENNLFFALVGIMIVSIILGMGVPSAVCYLLMATLMGSLLDQLGVPKLAAHLP